MKPLLLAFEHVADAVNVCKDNDPRMGPGSQLESRVITCPSRIPEEEFNSFNQEMDPRFRYSLPWGPQFWGDDSVVRTILQVLSNGITSPVYWTIGEYDPDELGRPPIERRAGPRMVTFVRTVLQWSSIESIQFPWTQGVVNLLGAAVFILDDRPDLEEHRAVWSEALVSDAAASICKQLYDAEIAPKSTVAMLAPYGIEDREHACVARAGWDADELLSNLSHALQARLIRVSAHEGVLRAWEINRSLPPEASMLLDTEPR